ncbi:hypothetical protein ACQEU5_07130 [Marinactinospora thermotolerans]|uniref:hypothetical protein n=1 Tax=Marinactinospora thermotolerans TaxID=531310 RepID=UPI003D8D684C
MLYVVAIVAGVLMLMFLKRPKASLKGWVPAGLAFICGACLAETGLGGWLASTLVMVSGWIVAPFGIPAVAVVSGIALILTVVLAVDLAVDRKPDKPAAWSLLVLPVLLVGVGGTLGMVGAQVTDGMVQVGSGAVSALIGVG